MEPSDLDKRAAKEFQALAKESDFFPVTCRFRRVIRDNERIEHDFWPEGSEEFRKHFGNASNFFAGAFEYIRLATGWKYPYSELLVMILESKKRTSSGVAMFLSPQGKSGEIRVYWTNGEFTLTVLHELTHLFKRGSNEGWVEQQALELIMGV